MDTSGSSKPASAERSGRARRSPHRSVVATLAVVGGLIAMTGCGVGSKKVAASVSTTASSTTSPATSTTVADTSTDTNDTSSDTSSDTSTDTNDTSSDTSTVGGTWPASIRKSLIQSCQTGLTSGSDSVLGGPGTCECVVAQLEKQFTATDILSLSTDPGAASRLATASHKAILKCVPESST